MEWTAEKYAKCQKLFYEMLAKVQAGTGSYGSIVDRRWIQDEEFLEVVFRYFIAVSPLTDFRSVQ
jgi:hypothetical protein